MTLLQTPDRAHFLVWATEFAVKIADIYRPDCIILFGSVARGEQTLSSDIDLLVIGGDLPENQRERFRTLMELRPRFAPIQVQSFTRDEWNQMRSERHVTVLESLHDGIPLHGQALFKQWRRQFKRWQQHGLRRDTCAWILPPTRMEIKDR